MVKYYTEQSCCRVRWSLFYMWNGGDAMRNQNNNSFDFKDLMTFGLFILALLTFIFANCK